VKVILIEDPDPLGPLGAKGIAEAAMIPTAPAITNGIRRALDVRIRNLPATPDRIAQAISLRQVNDLRGIVPKKVGK
jgi:CO/xanthine dehydrogenase Mo-binding subunit